MVSIWPGEKFVSLMECVGLGRLERERAPPVTEQAFFTLMAIQVEVAPDVMVVGRLLMSDAINALATRGAEIKERAVFFKAWWQREVTFGSVTATFVGTILGMVIAVWLIGL